MVNIGAADARPFAEIVRDMVKTVCELGLSPLNKNNAQMQQELRS